MNQQSLQFIHHVVDRLQSVEGIVVIALGGSRARGNHTPKSDVDLGLYYQPENPPDLLTLNHLASKLDDNHRTNLITPIGGWGKWMNGGEISFSLVVAQKAVARGDVAYAAGCCFRSVA